MLLGNFAAEVFLGLVADGHKGDLDRERMRI
jgi:hypothetical protein